MSRSTERWVICAFFLSVLAAVLGPGSPVATAQEAPPRAQAENEQPASFWMERKLGYSQEVLAGLSAGDFDKIVASARSMRGLNKVEAFVRGRDSSYRLQLQIFEASLDEIIRQAEKDNVEGSALGFTQLTLSCVNCHKLLRASK